MTRKSRLLVAGSACVLFAACSSHGQKIDKPGSETQPFTSTAVPGGQNPPAVNPVTNNVQAASPVPTITNSTQVPIDILQPCNSSLIAFAGPGQSCPKNYAAFTSDDGDEAKLGCCPLPTSDVLTLDPAQPRSSQCQPDEVATGVVKGRTLLCTKINIAKYRLGPSSPTCYYGSGNSGGDGSSKCGGPNATIKALASKFGSDACIGFPYGQLLTKNSGKECKDLAAAALLYLDGAPVKMFSDSP